MAYLFQRSNDEPLGTRLRYTSQDGAKLLRFCEKQILTVNVWLNFNVATEWRDVLFCWMLYTLSQSKINMLACTNNFCHYCRGGYGRNQVCSH